MKHVRMFVIILLVSAVATVYGQERHGKETGTAQLSIYKLPPLERAIRCTKYYEGWHGEKKHWPYVGWDPSQGEIYRLTEIDAQIRKIGVLYNQTVRAIIPSLPIL